MKRRARLEGHVEGHDLAKNQTLQTGSILNQNLVWRE